MCGITGKVSPAAPVDPSLLARMCDAIEHRGPDSRGTFHDAGVGLGVQRLAVIDLDTGDQPIFNEDRSIAVIQNGEIYNYRELRAELEQRGHRFRTRTDTEVIAHLYEDHGDACVERLRGMFALAVWDRSTQRLLLARDRVGKKPLFYARAGDKLCFASEIRSLLEDPEVPRDVDLDAIDSFLHYRYVPDPKSAFTAVRKLPPAHILTWSDGRVDLRRYWKLSYRKRPHVRTEDETSDLLREQLMEATRLRLRSDVPLGAFLSGGVDSSAVVAAMAREGGRVQTFSIGFDVAAFDETEHARVVAQLYGTDHAEFIVEPNVIETLPRLVWQYGEPFSDESALPTFHLSEQTARHVKVALSGDGGDENFAGYDRYRVQETIRRFETVPRGVVRVAGRALESFDGDPPMLLRRARSLFRYLSLPAPDRYAATVGNFQRPSERTELYTAELLAAIGEGSAPSVIQGPWAASDAESAVDRLLDVDVQTYLPGDLLVKVDIATMAHSLELRSPLLDHVFMETVAALPSSTKLRGSSAKHAFREALRGWLPDSILDRPKMGFGVPIGDWMRGPLRELPGEVLLDPTSVERGWFRPTRIRTLIDEHVGGEADHAALLWSLLQLELWLRTYVDGRVGAPPSLSLR